jgi:hypothetical protein
MTNQQRIRSIDFKPNKYAPAELRASVYNYLEAINIQVFEDTKILKGRGRWFVALPVGLWSDGVHIKESSRIEDDSKYLEFLASKQVFEKTDKGKKIPGTKGHGVKTRDVVVRHAVRFFSEPALRTLFQLRPELLLLSVAANMLAEFTVNPALLRGELRAFRLRTLLPVRKNLWEPWEDVVLSKWFGLYPGRDHHAALSPQIWATVDTALRNRRSRASVRRRLHALNRILYHKLLEEQDFTVGRQPGHRLNNVYVEKYIAKYLGERLRMPVMATPIQRSRTRQAAPTHCPSCGHDLTKKRSQRVPSEPQTPSSEHEQLSFNF